MKFNLFVLFVFCVCSRSFSSIIVDVPGNNLSNDDLHVKFVTNLQEFEALHPGVHVEQLISTNRNVNGQITYTLGHRIAGDRLLATSANNQHWPSPQNVALTLKYPSSGTGGMISFVTITVSQSTNLGQAYVTGGGLGQRFIVIVVECYSTSFLTYSALFYGM